MSLRELSIKAEISHTYLEKIELGNKAPPNDECLIKIEKSLALDDDSKLLFYEIAAKTKEMFDNKNFYISVDIAAHLSDKESAKDFIRAADRLGCDNEFWNKLLQKLKEENMSQ